MLTVEYSRYFTYLGIYLEIDDEGQNLTDM